MRKQNIKSLLPYCIFTSALLFFSLPQEIPSYQEAIEYEKRLEKITTQIENLRSKIQQEEKRKSSILSQLVQNGLRKTLVREEISLLNIQMEKATAELTSIKSRIPHLTAKLRQENNSIEKILVSMYKHGKLSYVDYFFQIEDIGNLISEHKHLIILAQHQENIISEYLKILNELKLTKEKQETKKNEIDLFIKNAQQKKKELEAQEKEYKLLIRNIAQNRKIHEKILEELKNRAERLQILIDKLYKEEISLSFALIPLYEKKGQLPWPIDGKIVTSFGIQKHPQFKTSTKNNGLVISAQPNMVIKAIHLGVIVYCDYFQGYGNLIIIDHGMSYYSLYGYCSEFLVKKGIMVKEKDPLAVVGDIGSLKGTALYFEIRSKTKPLNPLQWLKGR